MSSDSNQTAPPEPTTLRSLQCYAPRQVELIESFLDTFHFQDPDDNEWVQFWDSVWGKDPDSLDGTEVFERGSDTIGDTLILPDIVLPHRDVMLKPDAVENCWDLGCTKILIRSEYKEAEESILSVCGAATVLNALVVTGQPGIGKSVFLLRILLRRLALKLPTALQIDPDCALLFYQGGVKQFVRLNKGREYAALGSQDGPLGRIWALVDSDGGLHEPALVFQEGPFFTVETSSRPARCGWTMRVRSEFFHMKPWSFAEVLQVRSLIDPNPPSEKKLWYLHCTYGASLRSLFVFAEDPDRYDSVVNRQVFQLSPQKLTGLFLDIVDATDGSQYLISTGPLPTDRTMPERKFTSEYVLEKICRQALNGAEIWMLYDALRKKSFASAAAGMLFKYRVHQFLQEGRVIDLLPILGHISDNGKNAVYDHYTATDGKQITLPRSRKHIFTGEIDTTLEVDTYYRTRNANLPVIDSWLLVRPTPEEPPILLIFRMEVHDAEQNGLDKIHRLITPRGTQKHLIVITPAGVKPKITVSEGYLIDKPPAHRGPNVAFPVYHCQISSDALFRPLSFNAV